FCYACEKVLMSFFFQAEDGIRDFHVTGVQTCALPISWGSRALPAHPRPSPQSIPTCVGLTEADLQLCEALSPRYQRRGQLRRTRSEERRVGKEWRARCCGQAQEKTSSSVKWIDVCGEK